MRPEEREARTAKTGERTASPQKGAVDAIDRMGSEVGALSVRAIRHGWLRRAGGGSADDRGKPDPDLSDSRDTALAEGPEGACA
jgi:hypothetical protein